MGAFDLLAKAASAGAKKAAPFFSKADVVLDELQRNKGTGNEFLTEIVKKGAKPTELKERGIEKALKDKPKMTKAEVQKIFKEKAPPKVQEKVLSSDAPDYDEFLEQQAQEQYGVDYWELRKDEKANIDKMFNELPTTKYEQYRTPGGENYREILLKLPSRGLTDSERWELDLYNRDLKSAGKFLPEKQARYEELKAKEGNPDYVSGHYKEDPNLLAHIRVQDFQAPTRGFAVVNTRSGNKSEVFPTVEQAQAYLAQMPQNMQGMLRIDEAAGKPKKVLLVDEIQSDWHQEGRKKGYAQAETSRMPGNVVDAGDGTWKVEWPDGTFSGGYNQESAMQKAIEGKTNAKPGVPDAPFKKNWHELSMKRVLDYAAENGYDSVAITPGAEQAKRYDLSKQINDLQYDPQTGQLQAWDHSGVEVIRQQGVTPENLSDYVGKEGAQKLLEKESPVKQLFGADLQVGGEGMKGFYDKILPDYLNNYGKKYGAQTGQISLRTPSAEPWNIEDAARFHGMSGADYLDNPNRSQLEKQFLESRENKTSGFHSFDITPQMREEITTKGQPLYGKVATPVLEGLAAGTGAATIAPEVFNPNDEQQVQNPVHFTENPDAMLLELMQRN
jgi:hypothetical protein